jgi:hypothetical protein
MDVPLLPGSSSGLRASAAHLRSTLSDLDVARRAAVQIEAVTDGEHWRGEAFDAFRSVTERKPLPAAIDGARARMEEAAARLDWLAGRFDENQETLRWCRARLAGLDPGDPDAAAERAAIERDASRAWDDQRDAARSVADLFDWMDDQPVFATPPPSVLERVGRGAVSVVHGFAEGTWDLVSGVGQLALLLNPAALPFTLQRAWEHRDQFLAVLQWSWDDPGAFFSQLGRAMLDLDMLLEDPARWVGRRIPDILLALATAGLGTVGSTAAMSVRGLRGARLADAALGHAGLLSRTGRFTAQLDTASDATDLLGATTRMGRLNRLDADPARLVRVDGGAFRRTDTGLGRLGGHLDELGPVVSVGRQIPGRINDEIRGFTSVPLRMAGIQNITIQRQIDSVLTNGLTGHLGMADGLLVGSSALSPATQASMLGVLAMSGADSVTGPLEIYSDVQSAMPASCAVSAPAN